MHYAVQIFIWNFWISIHPSIHFWVSCHGVRGGVHPGLVTSLAQDRQPSTLTFTSRAQSEHTQTE